MGRNKSGMGGFDGAVAQFLNNSTTNKVALEEALYLRMIMALAIARFKWSGLPDEIDDRFVEVELFQRGLVLFFHDDDNYDRYFATSAVPRGPINQYRNPTQFRPYGPRFQYKELSGSECVPIWGNDMRIPEYDVLLIFASRLAEFDKSIDILVRRMRVPYIFAVEQSQRKSAQELWRQVENGEPAVFGTTGMNDLLDTMKTLPMVIDPDSISVLQVCKTRVWNECMGYLGINNANQDKKERLVESEVGANDSQVMISRRASLAARERAATAINDMFGLNVTVEWSDEVEKMKIESAYALGMGGDDNGSSDNDETDDSDRQGLHSATG